MARNKGAIPANTASATEPTINDRVSDEHEQPSREFNTEANVVGENFADVPTFAPLDDDELPVVPNDVLTGEAEPEEYGFGEVYDEPTTPVTSDDPAPVDEEATPEDLVAKWREEADGFEQSAGVLQARINSGSLSGGDRQNTSRRVSEKRERAATLRRVADELASTLR